MSAPARYSAMLSNFALLEGREVKTLRFAALLALDEGLADRLYFEATFLFTPDQVADCFAVVGVMAGSYLGGNPRILLFGKGDGLAYNGHCILHFAGKKKIISYYWCQTTSVVRAYRR